jgi:hypothetical protein
MTADEKSITATYFLGLVPLTVGLSIFLFWWLGKVWFLTTYHELETWGLFWVYISFLLGLMGLVNSLIYLSDHFKTDLKKGLFGLFCVLINIPVLIWIIDKQSDIDKRAYVRFYNNSGSDFNSLTIANSLYKERITSVESNDYQTGYFYPNYDEWDSGMSEFEDTVLTIEKDNEEKKIILPAIYKGECLKVFINNEFKIDIKGRWND